MRRTRSTRTRGIGALELIEEATSLLRAAPAEVLALYYLGALPFALGMLYFWADMSRNADAGSRLAGASLLMALLFVWMKYWQARFARELFRMMLNGSTPSSTPCIALAQTVFHPWSFVVLPLAFLVTLPFGWCFAFFQNITVMGGDSDLRRFYSRARRQAALWQGQNHVLMGIFLLLGMVVFSNLCIGAFLLPKILRSLFGVESIFTRSSIYLLNSTFWAAMLVLTHICIDPLIKTAYLLRCHYGESLASGADLLAELREARHSSAAGLATLILAATFLCHGIIPVQADAALPLQTDRPPINARQLDKTIGQVIDGPEFAWRLPRSEEKKGELPGFLRSALELLKRWARDAGDVIVRFLKWLADHLPTLKPKAQGAIKGSRFPDLVFPLLYGLLAICLSIGGVFLWRQARHRRETEAAAAIPPFVVEPDVSDENVTADELSEERWSALAGEFLARGELRLALRALYLACLAGLAEERLIAIARFKSNRDYEWELGRFAHTLPEVVSIFSGNVALFERVWYGMHRLEREMIEAFMANNKRISSGVRQK